jgi:hypothetical protein
MIYADTSCLLKVRRPEPLSEAVWSAIDEEPAVIVSLLAELETLAQLKAEWTGVASEPASLLTIDTLG